MMDFKLVNGWVCRIVENVDELPDPTGVKVLWADGETTSFEEDEEAFLPYSGHRLAGLAVVFDDSKIGYYIPVRHTGCLFNIPLEAFQAWLKKLIKIPVWKNHNIKFDAHFLAMDGAVYEGRMECTLTKAKILDSDRMGHDLKPLCREWCKLPMEEETRVKAYLKGIKSKNYGDVPADILGPYAVMDVFGGRELDTYVDREMPPETLRVVETEVKLTTVLFDIERAGLQVDPVELKIQLHKALTLLITLGDRINELTGREFTDSAQHIFDLFVNQMGLPVLSFNPETGNPSFDKDALALYEVHPEVTADPKKLELIKAVIAFRKEITFKGLFLEKFLGLRDGENLIHSFYNQIIRTGRMSCKNPNSQQNSKRSKGLIHPRKNRAFLSADASQIEFRLIVHYINDTTAIDAYWEDPDTDFHQWVANLCGIKRKQAKNVNFAIGYGAGKRKVVSMLTSNPEVMAEVGAVVNKMVEDGKITEAQRTETYKNLCYARANTIYATYHERLPNIKIVSRVAMQRCRQRGFVFNAFGRRRHLPEKFSHKAFNSVIQGCAMDFIKDRMIALAPRWNKWMRDHDIQILANVHDELVFEGPIEVMRDPATWTYLLDMLEATPTVKFRIPLVWGMGYSETSWAEASGDDVVFRRAGQVLKLDAKKYEAQPGDEWLAGPVPVVRPPRVRPPAPLAA